MSAISEMSIVFETNVVCDNSFKITWLKWFVCAFYSGFNPRDYAVCFLIIVIFQIQVVVHFDDLS